MVYGRIVKCQISYLRRNRDARHLRNDVIYPDIGGARSQLFRPAKMKSLLLLCAFFSVLSSLAYAQGMLGAVVIGANCPGTVTELLITSLVPHGSLPCPDILPFT